MGFGQTRVWEFHQERRPSAAVPGEDQPAQTCPRSSAAFLPPASGIWRVFLNKPTRVDSGSGLCVPPDGSVKPFSRLAYPRLWGKDAKQAKMMKQSEQEAGRRARRSASGRVPVGSRVIWRTKLNRYTDMLRSCV